MMVEVPSAGQRVSAVRVPQVGQKRWFDAVSVKRTPRGETSGDLGLSQREGLPARLAILEVVLRCFRC